MNQSTDSPSNPAPNGTVVERPKYTRRATSAGNDFQGQLKILQGATNGDNGVEGVETVTVDGKPVKIKHSGIVRTIPHEDSVAIPPGSGLDLVATLFYKTCSSETVDQDESTARPSRQDIHYGAYISDMAIFEFIQTIDRLIVPWKKGSAYHRSLDSSQSPQVVEIALSMPQMLNLDDLRRHSDLWQFEQKWNIEVVLQQNDVFRRYRRLAVFDMDSTLIQQEVIDEIARFIGVEEKVSAITARAMNGELDFTQSLKERVSLLKGVPATVFEDLKSVITFTNGAKELCKVLKKLGYKMAVLSGGFIPLANYIKQELGLDYAYANQLVVSQDGKELTGELTGDIVHAEHKAVLLEKIASENGIPLQQVVAIGDGANDLKMMRKAGLGIALNAKPNVQAEAPCRINSTTMQDVLYLLGLTKEEQVQLLKD
ncbi:HAD-like domain-containing protein [Geopyxis carbonaria]|nr:HAD-like domain-containing protein [Geopyxis carbonaria]